MTTDLKTVGTVSDRTSTTELLNEMNLEPDAARIFLVVNIGFPPDEADACVAAWLYSDAT